MPEREWLSGQPVIDMHSHVFDVGYLPATLQEATARAWAARVPGRRAADVRDRLDANMSDPTAEHMLADMDDAGVDVSVGLVLDTSYGFPDEPAVSALEVMRHYSRLQVETEHRYLGFAGADPRRPGATDIIRWALDDLDLRGVKLYPPHGYYASDRAALDICGVASEKDVPVLFHTAVVGPPALSAFADPLHLAMVQRSFPDLTVIIGHAGFDVWARTVARVAEGHDRTYLEISQWDSVARSDPERCIRTIAMWRDIVGAHRILFGSDHISGPGLSGPKSKLRHWVDFIRDLPRSGQALGISFTSDEVDLILGGNARRLLRL
ncbi:MAG: amidohydrolase family protein [Nocardioidaceae bacterium]